MSEYDGKQFVGIDLHRRDLARGAEEDVRPRVWVARCARPGVWAVTATTRDPADEVPV